MPLNAPSTAPLQTWLQSRSAEALSPAMRTAIADAVATADATAGMPDPWPVLIDTLEALAGLSAEADVLLAALLFGLPGLQSALKAQLGKSAGVTGLLDGQNAAAQVW